MKVETIWEPALSAGWSNYVSKPPGFGTGLEAYGYHYGVSIADNVNGKFFRTFVFAAASGRRDTYEPIRKGGIWKRVRNAVEYTVLPAPEETHKGFNLSGLPASAVSASLSNAYQPFEQRTWRATLERIGTNTGGYVLGNVWLEFTKKTTDTHPHLRLLLKNR